MVRMLHGPIDCAYAVTAWRVNGTPTPDFIYLFKKLDLTKSTDLLRCQTRTGTGYLSP